MCGKGFLVDFINKFKLSYLNLTFASYKRLELDSDQEAHDLKQEEADKQVFVKLFLDENIIQEL